MTLQLLWEAHRAAYPKGYGYIRFCELYRAREGRRSPTIRQTHVAGERLFVDCAGTTLEVINGRTGEVITAQLFVAALGASSYSYAEARVCEPIQSASPCVQVAFAFVTPSTARTCRARPGSCCLRSEDPQVRGGGVTAMVVSTT